MFEGLVAGLLDERKNDMGIAGGYRLELSGETERIGSCPLVTPDTRWGLSISSNRPAIPGLRGKLHSTARAFFEGGGNLLSVATDLESRPNDPSR